MSGKWPVIIKYLILLVAILQVVQSYRYFSRGDTVGVVLALATAIVFVIMAFTLDRLNKD